MESATFNQVMTLITVVGTGVGTVLLQMWREARNRRWAMEDRQILAAELAAKTKHDHDVLAANLERERANQHRFRQETKTAIEGVHQAADAAYKEANHVNNKIGDLNEQLLAQAKLLAAEKAGTAEPLQAIQKTGEETKTIAEEINRKI
jgi:hypothetical protein